MNHQPFEDWLIENQSLTSQQSKDLGEHLNKCSYCSALVQVDQVFQTSKMASPPQGFVDRFRVKLVEEQKLRHKRLIWGMGSLGIIAVLLVVLFGYQYLSNWTISPTDVLVNFVTWITGFSATIRAYGSVGMVLINMIYGIIPLPLWLSFFFGGFLLVLAWATTLWKLSYSIQARRLK
ncbi:hypothetical protein ACFLXB_03140 [Chloroflexota bacterium]